MHDGFGGAARFVREVGDRQRDAARPRSRRRLTDSKTPTPGFAAMLHPSERAAAVGAAGAA